MYKNIVIILAAGRGLRFENETPKAFVKISGRPVLSHTLQKFDQHKEIDGIIIVTQSPLLKLCEDLILEEGFKKVLKIIPGGEARQDSTWAGLKACAEFNPKNVLVHDAVRPFISPRIISAVIKALGKFSAVDVAIPTPDTLIKVDSRKVIRDIPERKYILRGQTPQGFHFQTLMKAHELSRKEHFKDVTDDCGLVLKYKLGDILVVDGEDGNIKITYPLDIHIADKIFQVGSVNSQELGGVALKLRGKNILIFGQSSGIGKEIYEICKSSKANVVGYSSSTADITDYHKVREVLDEFVKNFGKIDILISTAAILKRGNLVESNFSDIDRQISVNYISQVNLVREAFPLMISGGSIALFASSSYTRGRGTYSIYSSTKAAIVNFVQAVSEEFAKDKIRINVICPDRTNTRMRWRNFGKEPLKYLLDPKIVAEITLKACLSDFTGQVINIRNENY
ncbi:MAG: 2-C-methyl-D-erythritol 4-phosphate cytidylyltransferase [Parcubacteria group bacterium]